MADDSTDPTPKARAPRGGQWEARFLQVLAGTGNIRLACHAAGIDRTTAYHRRSHVKSFAEKWKAALDDALDLLEAEAWKRARASSDRLIEFLLKSHRPEVYGDRLTIIKAAAKEVKEAPTADLLAYLGYDSEPAERG